MANIPVEKSETSFLPWILGLLALVALVWLGLELFDDEPDADEIAGMEDNVGVVDDVDLGDDDVSMAGDVDGMARATGLGTLTVGDDVSIEGLRVTNVMSDKTFMVDDTDDSVSPMLVVLDEEPTPGVPGVEGRYDVNEGQTLTLYGDVRRIESNTLQPLGISAAGMDGLNVGDLYLHADRLDITEAELETVEVD